MSDVRHWVQQASRIHEGVGYTYADLSRDMANTLGWTTAADMACALRAHVYGWPGDHTLHTTVKPIYDRLGWEQAALVTCWFRDSRNWPGPKRTGQRLPGGWPAAAKPHTNH